MAERTVARGYDPHRMQEQSNRCERIGHCRGASTRRVPSRVAYAGESFDTYSTIERRSSNAGSVQMTLPIQPPSAQPPLGIRPDLRRLLPYLSRPFDEHTDGSECLPAYNRRVTIESS